MTYPPASTCASAREYEVVIHDGPLPAYSDAELSEREKAFRDALAESGKPASRFSRWAAVKRAEWMSERGLKAADD